MGLNLKPKDAQQIAQKLRKKLHELNICIDAGLSNTVSASSSSIRRQGKKGNIYVNVGDEIFEGEDVLDGWLTHFSKLAEPSNNPETTHYEYYAHDEWSIGDMLH
jgi:hypothetical protein